jgi:hypothetical protein
MDSRLRGNDATFRRVPSPAAVVCCKLIADSFWSAKLTAGSFYGYTEERNFWLAASVLMIKARKECKQL